MIVTESELRGFRNRTRDISKGIQDSLNEWVNESRTGKVTVFLSHKHDEIEELDSAISLLKLMGVEVYVDWQDKEMPKSTNGATARIIKRKISENKKFILLATEAAIASKWCNWELGYGDSMRYMDHIAIFPISRSSNRTYSGSEYLSIYSSIEYEDGTSKTVGGNAISKGWYVFEPPNENGSRSFKTLKSWLTT
jgi:hypothetical protein